MEYERLFEELWKANVRSLVCGGLAVNIYGIPRMTADIDLLLDFEKENLSAFEKTTKALSYRSLVPVPVSQLADETERENLVKTKNMVAYSFYNSVSDYMSIDVLLDTPFSFEELWKKREVRSMGDFSVNLVSLKHLIEMKNYSNRKQDRDDVLLLSELLKKK